MPRKSWRLPPTLPERDTVAIFRFIVAEKATYAVSLMCSVLEVSRSGFYAWLHRPPSDRRLADEWLTGEDQRYLYESRGSYGSPRIHAALRAQNIYVSRKRVERLMRMAGITGISRRPERPKTTIRLAGYAPLLILSIVTSHPQNPTLCGAQISSATRRCWTVW